MQIEVPPRERVAVRTFLIADVRGYTRFTVEHGDEAAARLADRFAALCEERVCRHGGEARYLARLHERLPDEVFGEEWLARRALTLEGAIELALTS